MSLYSYNDDDSVGNCYSDDNSAVSSTHSPPNSPSSYDLDDHPEHDLINPPPASTNLNFYGKTSVTFNSRPPALIKFNPDIGQTDTPIKKWEHNSNPNCDSVNSVESLDNELHDTDDVTKYNNSNESFDDEIRNKD